METFGTGTVSDEKLEEAVEKVFDLRPTAIIRDLDLRQPIYRQLAAYGHMGREDSGRALGGYRPCGGSEGRSERLISPLQDRRKSDIVRVRRP